jgi:tRNA threonylcarbamoyladenosine modification (KEOPS) complex  Pcc1 subunit
MDERAVITLMFLAVLASGCADSSSDQGIAVEELQVEPSSIYAGSSTSVSMNVVNSGLLEADLVTGENGNDVLTNHCTDIFEITEYRASSSNNYNTTDSYSLETGEQARFYWRLEQKDTDEVPLNGFRCDLKFELPFNYSVNAYKQLQFKQSREVEGSTELGSQVSGGPLRIVMEVVGSTSEQPGTILTQDDASIYVTVENTDSSESPYQGLIEVNSIDITSSDNIDLEENCGDSESVTLSTGSQNIYKCSVEPENMDSPSIRGEVDVEVDYTFVKDVGSRRVEVQYRE